MLESGSTASAKKKMTAPKIARALKRTERATRQKAFSIGLSLDSRGRAFQEIIHSPHPRCAVISAPPPEQCAGLFIDDMANALFLCSDNRQEPPDEHCRYRPACACKEAHAEPDADLVKV